MPDFNSKASFCFFLFALLFTTNNVLEAQYRMVSIGREKLPSFEKPYWCTETSEGHYYLTGKRGIMEYNDAGVTNFLMSLPSGEKGIDQNQQSPLVEDKKGFLWGTTYSWLFRFNPADGTFMYFNFQLDEVELDTDYKILRLQSKENELWVKAGNTIWTFNTISAKKRLLSNSAKSVFYAGGNDSRYLVGVAYTNSIEIFTSKENKKLNRPRIITLSQPAYSVAFGCVDSVAYVGTKTGVVKINIGSDTITTQTITQSGPTIALAYDANTHLLWQVSRRNSVIATSEKSETEIIRFTPDNGLSTPKPRKLSIDRSGHIWISHYEGGYDIILPEKSNFLTLNNSTKTKIVDLIQTDKRTIVSVTPSGEINSSPPPYASWSKESDKVHITPHLHQWRSSVYLTSNFYLGRRHENGEWSFFRKPDPTNINGLFLPYEHSPLTLSPNGIKTIAFDADTIRYEDVPAFQHLPTQDCGKLFQLSDYHFLLSYQDQEVWTCQIKDNSYKLLHRAFIPGEISGAIMASDNKTYLVAASGLYQVQGDTATLLLQSLPNGDTPSFKTIIEDSNRLLWLGTNIGLISYSLTDNTVRFFSKNDGLPTNNFRESAPFLDSSKHITMLTDLGAVVFDPAKISTDQQQYHPYIKNIWVNNIPFSGKSRPQFLDHFVQPYQRNSLNFTFLTTALETSPLSTVEYQLIDYDLTPQRTPTGQNIRYPNLPPGTYTLQLTAINQNGLPSGKKSLQITINPPYWQTWWFRLACILFLALVATGIYIAGLRRERLKQQRLSDQRDRLAAERDRIAGEVHDDLGGQISSILYLSEEMLLTNTAPANERELNRIHELSRTSLQNVRDIIFALDNRRATLAALGEQLRGAGTDFFTDRKIAFTCTDNFSRPDFSLTSRQKRNLTLIVKEAWHNTAKHAAATAVTLDITQANGTLHLTCTDNGKGFTSTQSDKATGGYGLENMTEKADAIGAVARIESEPGQGTKVNISWPLPVDETRS